MNSVELVGGRYEVRDVLGFGATAEVCGGWDNRLNRPVALKLLHRGLSSHADVRERFIIEARAAAALSHSNIVRVYDIGAHNETPFIVMERLPGDTLGDQIALGPLPQEQVYTTLRSVLAALAVAHDAGMLHRDIKPGNLLLAPTGIVKVADFGIVKTASSVHTTTGHIVGTLAYMSPDRVSGKPASVSDDLYAVGVVGYEALTGRKPFWHEDIMPLAHAIIEGRPPSVAKLRPDVDPVLADVIERAMSRDPVRRFASADAMRSALSGEELPFAGAVSTSTRGRSPRTVRHARLRPVSAVTAASPTAVRHSPKRAPEVVGAAAVLGAMTFAVLAFASNPSSTTPPTTPGNFSVSTPESAPIGAADMPSWSAPAGPPPLVPVAVLAEEEPLAPSPTVEPTMRRDPRDPVAAADRRGAGSGNSGNAERRIWYGNGNGPDRIRGPKTNNGNGNGSGNRGNRSSGNGKGNANGNGGNGNGKR